MQGVAVSIPSGDAGIRATVAHMRQLARMASLDPAIRATTVNLVDGQEWGRSHPITIRDWIDGHTRFLADPAYGEALHAPRWILDRILTTGRASIDCDDVAMLAAAMGLSIGLRARYVVVAFKSPQAPYSHIWTDLSDARRELWVAVDPTRPAQGLSGLRISRGFQVDV